MATNEELKARLEKCRRERAALKAERDAIGSELVSCREANDELQAAVDRLNLEIAQLRQELADCQDVEPPPDPEPGKTGVILPDGKELVVDPPVGPFNTQDGGGTANYGVQYARGTLVPGPAPPIRKVRAGRHNRDNIHAMAWSSEGALPVDPPLLIEDCIAEDAKNITGAAAGTTESNFWIGCSAHVQRIEGRRADWMGMFTGGSSRKANGGCYRSLIEHVRLTEQIRGIYLEHVTVETHFRNLWVEASNVGITVEWWYGTPPIGSHTCLIEDFYIDCPNWAIRLDVGSSRFHIRNGICPRGRIELPNYVCDPKDGSKHHRSQRPDLDNAVENVTRPDGTPVPIVYHNRGA